MIEQSIAIDALAALAHDARLNIFRLLIGAGREGLAAGEIGQALAIPASALSFHLARLRHAGLVTRSRQGQQIVYATEFRAMQELIEFLTNNCCARSPSGCDDECPSASDASIVRRDVLAGALRRPDRG